MYHSSYSWGKLGGQLENYTKKYISDELNVKPFDINDQDFDRIISEMFSASMIKDKTQLDIYKELLEVIRMPVLNPKTGEQDYVDLKLVNKIVINSDYVEDMVTNEKVKLNFTLSSDEQNELVNIKISSNDHSSQANESVSLQRFEEMLFKSIHEIKEQRLEDVEEFKSLTDSLIDRYISMELAKQKHLARLNQGYELHEGVGIIRDTITNQEIGTFESFEYLYGKKERTLSIEGVILSGRTFDDLEEKDRFEFTFYSLKEGLLYSVIPNQKGSLSKNDNGVVITNFPLLIEAFSSDHKHFGIISEAQSQKSLLHDLDQNHPLYDTNMEKFRQSRLNMLEESKNRVKQEKLVNQFADIDLF
jgi:hypothetical protein